MTWRLAEDADLDWILAFLHRHVQSSMFLLGNLIDHGLHDRETDRAMTLWRAVAPVPGVFAVTNAGMVLMQAPGAPPELLRDAAMLLADREPLIGCVGETSQLRAFLAAAGLDRRTTRLDRDEPAFHLHLRDLILPDIPDGMYLAPLSELPLAQAVDWRRGYHVETLGTAPDMAQASAAADIADYLQRNTHRVLFHKGEPVAMTGFNVALPEVVQVGGVYTPPTLRCRGHARRAAALHLAEARQQGATRSVLFASGTAAVRAYMSIGYQRAGGYSLVLFDTDRKDRT